MSEFESAVTETAAAAATTEEAINNNNSKDPAWVLAEEAEIAKNPAPPLWNENVEERFLNKSFVFLEPFDRMHWSWTEGGG